MLQGSRRGGRRPGREPGPPAEGEGAEDEVPVPTDRLVGADHEVGPAQLLLELLVALLDPVPQAVQPDDLGQVGRGERRLVGVRRIRVAAGWSRDTRSSAAAAWPGRSWPRPRGAACPARTGRSAGRPPTRSPRGRRGTAAPPASSRPDRRGRPTAAPARPPPGCGPRRPGPRSPRTASAPAT